MIRLEPFEYVIVSVYLLFVLLLGIWKGRKVKNLNDYAVASRSYGSLIIFMTLSASFIGGGFTMAACSDISLQTVKSLQQR